METILTQIGPVKKMYNIALVDDDTDIILNHRHRLRIPQSSLICLNERRTLTYINHPNTVISFIPTLLDCEFTYDKINHQTIKFAQSHLSSYHFIPFLDDEAAPYGIVPLSPYRYNLIKYHMDIIRYQIKHKNDSMWICKTRTALTHILTLSEYLTSHFDHNNIHVEIARYIINNLSESAKLVESNVIDHFGIVDAPTFSKVFSDFFGMCYVKYVTRLKITIACYKLIYTDEPLVQIALSIGVSHNYFDSIFKKHKHITPSEYRNRARMLNPFHETYMKKKIHGIIV